MSVLPCNKSCLSPVWMLHLSIYMMMTHHTLCQFRTTVLHHVYRKVLFEKYVNWHRNNSQSMLSASCHVFQNSFVNKGLVCIHGEGKGGWRGHALLKISLTKTEIAHCRVFKVRGGGGAQICWKIMNSNMLYLGYFCPKMQTCVSQVLNFHRSLGEHIRPTSYTRRHLIDDLNELWMLVCEINWLGQRPSQWYVYEDITKAP